MVAERDTLARSMHDIGIAAWFGGSLMGAVGLNGGAATADDPQQRLAISSRGWQKWAPLQVTAILVHGLGGLALVEGNKLRLVGQLESRRNAKAKTVVTAVALASTLASGIAGRVMAKRAKEGADGVTDPKKGASRGLTRAQRMQRFLQWTTPALTAVVIVLAAQQGEQQRPIKGLFRTTLDNFRH